MYGVQDEGVTYLGYTSFWDRNEAPSQMSAAGQAEQTCLINGICCRAQPTLTIRSFPTGMALQDSVRFDFVPWFSTATSRISMSTTHVERYLQEIDQCPREERIELHCSR